MAVPLAFLTCAAACAPEGPERGGLPWPRPFPAHDPRSATAKMAAAQGDAGRDRTPDLPSRALAHDSAEFGAVGEPEGRC